MNKKYTSMTLKVKTFERFMKQKGKALTRSGKGMSNDAFLEMLIKGEHVVRVNKK